MNRNRKLNPNTYEKHVAPKKGSVKRATKPHKIFKSKDWSGIFGFLKDKAKKELKETIEDAEVEEVKEEV